MGGLFSRSPLRLAVIGIVAALLVGAIIAILLPITAERQAVPVAPIVSGPSFGSYFVHFFPGRTPDGSPPKSKSLLLRADKFLAGERVGIRVQTAPERQAAFVAEVRFLDRASHEERPATKNSRRRFRIRPGLRTYCCLRMPSTAGDYSLGILVDERYVTFLPITVKAPANQGGGGLFVRPEQ